MIMEKILKYKKIIIIVGISICFLAYYLIPKNKVVENEFVAISNEEEVSSIKVDIKGAVNSPGVYEVASGSRVIDLINLAGGLLSNANTKIINLSKLLLDENIIIIYTNEEIEEYLNGKVETKIEYIYLESTCVCLDETNNACINSDNLIDTGIDNSSDTNLININTATISELMNLTGIGEAKASSIIEYRNTNGLFKNITDITNVTGIGDSVYEKIKEQITI